jgi:hypothetical protein
VRATVYEAVPAAVDDDEREPLPLQTGSRCQSPHGLSKSLPLSDGSRPASFDDQSEGSADYRPGLMGLRPGRTEMDRATQPGSECRRVDSIHIPYRVLESTYR